MLFETKNPAQSRKVSTPVRYVPALTGLRAVAAYLVFLHHYNPASPGSVAHRLFNQGYMGVSVFFVLSGFLLYHQYADAYLDNTNWSWQRYLKNRFARIYPLYALLLVLTVGAHWLADHPMGIGLFVLNLTLLKGFFDSYKFSGIAQSWSLTVEGCFYLTAPLLFGFLRRWGAFWVTAGLIGGGLGIWAALGLLLGNDQVAPLPFVLFYTAIGRAFEFVLGMWLARQWHQQQLPAVRYPVPIGLAHYSGLC